MGRERRTMKNIALLSLLTLAILQPLAEAQRGNPPTFSCPEGWIDRVDQFGKCYYLFSVGTETGWQDAEDFCKSNEGHLVSLHSNEENQFLADTFISKKTWIGGRKMGSQWTWSDGTSWNYENWKAPAEPSGDGDCVDMGYFIYWGEPAGVWNDSSCNSTGVYTFLCQRSFTECVDIVYRPVMPAYCIIVILI